MNMIISGLITVVLAILTLILITLNENKKELWNEFYRKLRRKK